MIILLKNVISSNRGITYDLSTPYYFYNISFSSRVSSSQTRKTFRSCRENRSLYREGTSIVVSSVIIAFHNHNTSPFLLEATTSAVYLVYYCVLCCVLLRHVCIFSVARTDSAKCTLLSPLLALCCVGETNVETSVERKSDSRHEFTRSIRPSRTDWTRDRETWSASKHARFLSRASGTAWAVVPMT